MGHNGVAAIADDLLVSDCSKEERDANVHTVLQKPRDKTYLF